MIRVAWTMLLILMVCTSSLAQDHVRGRASVIDGDTIEINHTRIRLHGIDAPETGQQCNDQWGKSWYCGTDAATMLMALIDGQVITCSRTAADDQYGRMIAVCKTAKRHLNAEMVARGMAWSFQQYSHDYVGCEADAKKRRIGIWQVQQSQPPWDYRNDAWEDALRTAPVGWPIKGNFRAKGGCIYHTPWSQSYRQLTNMKPPNRWFATETEAVCRRVSAGEA